MQSLSEGRASKARTRRPQSASWVEVDLGAVRHNLLAVQSLIGPACDVWAVVKANAYGHGAAPVAKAALEGGAAGLAVASWGEALQLRRAGIESPILLLSAGELRLASGVVRHGIIQTVCTPEMVEALARSARRTGKAAEVHLKIDTGLGRLGVRPEAAAEFAAVIEGTAGVRLRGVFSHLATAEADNTAYVNDQFSHFNRAVSDIAAAGIDPGIRHLAGSAAALRFPQMRLDRVRTGLLVYGIRPDAPGLEAIDLRPALEWKTRLAFTQELPAGSAISYGCTYVTKGRTRTGVLPLGYADGYPRHASNRAHVLVRGQACPVVGRVCMDHVIIDATAAGDVKPGEEVVLIGAQGNRRISANDLAQWAGTCAHEVTTVIGPRVARLYFESNSQPSENSP